MTEGSNSVYRRLCPKYQCLDFPCRGHVGVGARSIGLVAILPQRSEPPANQLYDAGEKAKGARGIATSGLVSSDPPLEDLGISKQKISDERQNRELKHWPGR
jgi:hypothetical protein